MKHLDLFSGIGGFALAASWVWGDEYENIGHSEIDSYACRVYHNHFPESDCIGDITKTEWQEGQADFITAGFPCQPHSLAGKRQGFADTRDLWGETARAIRMVRPRFALLENVPGIVVSNNGRFFNRIMSDMAQIGYDAEWYNVGAWHVGAPHKRNRIWIVAYAEREGLERYARNGATGSEQKWNNPESHRSAGKESICNAEIIKQRAGLCQTESAEIGGGRPCHTDWWDVEPELGRVANGIPDRMDRLRGLGNAIVPQVAAMIMLKIKAITSA